MIDELNNLGEKADKLRIKGISEAVTKQVLVIPFLRILGYDDLNPEELIPEYIADVGVKKGEKVDFAILKEGNPLILIEVKKLNEKLESHCNQLFRYFVATRAKFGILTNGLNYKFYTDLDEANKMDLIPFIEINLDALNDFDIEHLKMFRKDSINLNDAIEYAVQIKNKKLIKDYILEQMRAPSEEFVKLIMSNFYKGVKTKPAIERFKPIVKQSFNSLINEIIENKLKTLISCEEENFNTTEIKKLINDDSVKVKSNEQLKFIIDTEYFMKISREIKKEIYKEKYENGFTICDLKGLKIGLDYIKGILNLYIENDIIEIKDKRMKNIIYEVKMEETEFMDKVGLIVENNIN